MIAWRLGEEMAATPELELQGPDELWRPGLIAMSDDRLEAMERLTPETFFEWVGRGVAAWNRRRGHG